jgi:hypothetical protein
MVRYNRMKGRPTLWLPVQIMLVLQLRFVYGLSVYTDISVLTDSPFGLFLTEKKSIFHLSLP